MKDMIIETYLDNDCIITKVNKEFEIKINITENKFNIPVENLFQVAIRNNKKRRFLFVSKLLGKHIPVHPSIPSIGGRLLASLLSNQEEKEQMNDLSYGIRAIGDYRQINAAMDYYNSNKLNINEKTLFIGFAETATGLGNGIFEAFNSNVYYVHTTRDNLIDMQSIFSFEEVHSHDVDHMCYLEEDSSLNDFQNIVLVDDEITTGNSGINLINSINSKYPGKNYKVISILDWRTGKQIDKIEQFKKENNLKIDFYSLIKGEVEFSGDVVDDYELMEYLQDRPIKVSTLNLKVFSKEIHKYKDSYNYVKEVDYVMHTGRFGLDKKNEKILFENIKRVSEELNVHSINKKTLCLGFNEFIYIPSKISEKLIGEVWFHSTTRSPIYSKENEEYCIKSANIFDYPQDLSIKNYIYNLNYQNYDQVFIFLERDIDNTIKDRMNKIFSNYGILNIFYIVI
jgi:uracil phosphoribosyltransferase